MPQAAPKPAVNTRMPKGAKRPKTSRACLACRKLKARCEPIASVKTNPADDPQPSNPSFLICHRCKTLCIDCLYETPTGDVVHGQDVQPISTSSPEEEFNRTPHPQKRPRPADVDPSVSDPFTNERAIFLSPAITPSPLTRSIYRDIAICSLNTEPSHCLERPVLAANALSRLIGVAPSLKRTAQDYILGQSGASTSASPQAWKQAPANLCAAKSAARLMSGQALLPPHPTDELGLLNRLLEPHEQRLRVLYQGLYGAYSPFLSTPFEDSLNLATCQSEAQRFLLLTIYLAALPHLASTRSIDPARKPLRKAVDALLRRTLHTPTGDHLNIYALHNCASFLLLPVDAFVEDYRPISTPEQENDGLLEFALDLNPRAAIITALLVAQRLGYASLSAKLPSIRQAFEAESPPNGYPSDPVRDEYAHAVLCTFTWLVLLQFRASIDVAEDRVEWDSLAQFEHDIPHVRIDSLTASLLPPPTFLSAREQSRCCWMAQRAELYTIARNHRHTKRTAATFAKKEAEEQALGYKKALDEWRYKFNEQMRSMSREFRKDPRGLGLHRFYSVFSNAEAASLQVSIGSIYHKEFVADMRQRLAEPFYRENLPWKSAATIMLGHEKDQLTKAILINFAFTDAMLKALGLISSLAPVMPQLYDFVSYEEAVGSEIPSLCIVAPPTLQAGLFAVPLLAAADLRLSVIETWGASASYFNHHLLPLLTNCVKSLRACHVNVDLPGVLKFACSTANPIADYLQGPFEILMRKVAAAEERLQISHVESILNNAFLLSSKKKQIEALAEELAPDTPEMVQSIADSQKIEDEIADSMVSSLHVQAIKEIEDSEYAVKVFGSDLRQGDVRPIRKEGRTSESSATSPDAESSINAGSNARSGSVESEQTRESSALTTSSKRRTTMRRSVRSVADTSQISSPGSSTQSAPALHVNSLSYSMDSAQAQPAFEGQGHGSIHQLAAPAGYAPPSPRGLQQEQPSSFLVEPQHKLHTHEAYPTSYHNQYEASVNLVHDYELAHEGRSPNLQRNPDGLTTSAPYPAHEQRFQADGMVSTYAHGGGTDSISHMRPPSDMDAGGAVWGAPPHAHAQSHSTTSFDDLRRQAFGVKMVLNAYEQNYPEMSAGQLHGNASVSAPEAWTSSDAPVQPPLHAGFYPADSSLFAGCEPTKYNPYLNPSAPRQTGNSAQDCLPYTTQQVAQQRGYADSQYGPVSSAEESGHAPQQYQHVDAHHRAQYMHPDPAVVASASERQPLQSHQHAEHAQPHSSTIWNAFDWTSEHPPQHQQQQQHYRN